MVATTSHPPNEAATDFPPSFSQAQRDAFNTIHRMMLKLADAIDNPLPPEQEDPAQARTATQRIRLCIQAARDLLRLTPRSAQPDSDDPASQRGASLRSTRPLRKHGLGVTITPTAQARAEVPTPTQTAQSAPTNAPSNPAAPQAQARAKASSSSTAAQAASLLAAAGHGAPCVGRPSRPEPEDKCAEQRSASISCGERLPDAPIVQAARKSADTPLPSRDSGLSTHDSSAPAPSAPQPVISPPEPFHRDELSYITIQLQKSNCNLPLNLYNKAKAWNDYTTATGIKSPGNFYWPEILKYPPSEPLDVIRR